MRSARNPVADTVLMTGHPDDFNAFLDTFYNFSGSILAQRLIIKSRNVVAK